MSTPLVRDVADEIPIDQVVDLDDARCQHLKDKYLHGWCLPRCGCDPGSVHPSGAAPRRGSAALLAAASRGVDVRNLTTGVANVHNVLGRIRTKRYASAGSED